MKKIYSSPDFEFLKFQLTDNICVSNPEGYNGGGDWGGNGENEAGED